MLVGRFLRDMPTLARDVVRFVGQKVAAVAADDADAAEEALQRIEVEYEELTPVLDPLDAMRPDAARHRTSLHSAAVDASTIGTHPTSAPPCTPECPRIGTSPQLARPGDRRELRGFPRPFGLPGGRPTARH